MIYDAIKDKYKCPIELVILMKNVFFRGTYPASPVVWQGIYIFFWVIISNVLKTIVI